MMDDRETVDLTGEEFYDEDDLEELEEPDGLDGPDGDGAVCVETDAHRAREPWAMSVVPR